MIKKTCLSFLLLALLSIYGCQIIPTSHKPILLDINNNRNSNNLSLVFDILDDGNTIILSKGYAFIARISGEVSTSSSSCSVSGSNGSIGTFVQSFVTSDKEIRCVYDETSTSDISLSGKITITFTGLNFLSKSYNSISLGLYTNVDNGVLIVKNASFSNFAIYDNYEFMTDALVTISNVDVKGTNISLDCPSITSTSCNNLYPYNDFTLSFNIEVKKYISSKDVFIGFEINGNYDASALSIFSTAVVEDNKSNATTDPLLSKLKSSYSNGLLTLTKLSDKKYVISNIATYVDETATTKVFMLDRGRKFTITLSGFSTGNRVNVNAISTIAVFASWKNTNSIFSYDSLSINRTINSQNIIAAIDNGVSVNYSVSHVDGTDIYENGAWPLTFKLRIPRANAGTLKITSIDTGNIVFSLIASTCDFSDNTNYSFSSYESRPLCIPSSNNADYNKENRRTFGENGTNNNSIEIQMSRITGNYRDLVLNVWGYANKCSNYDGATYTNLLADTKPSYKLRFKYEYTTSDDDKIVVASTSEFDTEINCYKNIRPSSSDVIKYNTAQANNSLITTSGDGSDYLLYNEITNWNPKNGITYNPDIFGNQDSISINSGNFIQLNDITESMDFNIFIDNTNILNNFLLPYTNKTSRLRLLANSVSLLPGRYQIIIPNNIVDKQYNQDCVLALMFKTSSDAVFFRKNSLTNDSISVTSTSITTTLVNDGTANTLEAFNYENTDKDNSVFGMYTNCYSYKVYSNITIKSIFQHASMFINYERHIASNNYLLNRVNRFFKFYNGLTYGFKYNEDNSFSTGIKLFRPNGTNTPDKLCILEVDKDIFYQNNINTLIITLMNKRLAKIGNYDPTDYYPASSINYNIKSFPLYTIEPTDLASSNTMDTATLINTGYLHDMNNLSHIVPFLANSIVFNKSSGIFTHDDLSSNVLMPIPCGINDDSDKFLIQGLSIGSTLMISNNIIFTSNDTSKIYLSTPISTDSQLNNENLNFKFTGYRDSSQDNKLYLSNFNSSTSIKSGILLVDNIYSEAPEGTTGFFGTSFISGAYSGITINDISYSHYYFLTGTSTIFYNNSIDFLARPSYSSYTASSSIYKIKLHATSTYSNGSNYNAYITNNTTNETKNLITDDTKILSAPNSFTPVLSFTVTAGETNMYQDDNGAIVTITVTIYSDFTTTGTLKMFSHNFISESLCARSSDYLDTCTYLNNTMTCNNVSVNANTLTTISYKCFNVKLASSFLNGNSTSSFVFKADSGFTSDYDFLNLSANLLGNKSIVVGSNYPLVYTIIPRVDSINYFQTNNKGGLANAYIKINLIRKFRLGQIIILEGDFRSIIIEQSPPSCSFMIVQNIPKYNETEYFDSLTDGTQFVESCVISSYSITLSTNKNLLSFSSFSQYVYIKLSPVYVDDLSSVKYSITTYLDNIISIASISAAPKIGDQRDNLPFATLSSDSYTVTDSPTTGLCNLSEIFPRIPSTIGNLTFNVYLRDTTGLLASVNAINNTPNSTTKVLNEVSIFMDPSIYMRNENILCSYNDDNIPCEWTTQGYINIKFIFKLVDGDYNITIIGVTIPNIAIGKNDSNFNCSVNYFNNDSRENLIVGLGSSTIYTYTPTTIGNIIQYTSPDSMTSTNDPRSDGTFNFRMNIDTSLGLTELPRVLSAVNGSSPVLLIGFPSEYNFTYMETITATLTYTKYSSISVTDETGTEFTYTAFGDPATISTSSIEVKGNFVIVNLSETITINSDVAYFDLALNNVPTPWSAVDSSLINIYMINELDAPTMMFSTYPNLSNSFGKKISINDYYHGPSFSFSDSTKALINTSSSSFFLKPGRYMPINFTVSGTNANASTALSLDANATIKSLQSSITLNTGLTKTGTLNLGVSCSTLPGSYWASFSLTATTGFYGLSPIRIIVTPVTGNKGSLYINSSINTYVIDSTYTLINGGYSMAYINTPYPVVDSINISLSVPSSATNDTKFTRFSADGAEDIAARNMSSQFSYTITSSKDNITAQQITLTSGSRCFGFGSATSPNITITYTVEGTLADLSNINIASMFLYDVSNEKKNEFDLLFTPIANTNAVFALVCADSEYPTYATTSSIANIDSFIYKFQSKTFYDTKQTTISFVGLKRGTSYKLKVWLTNFSATDNSLTSYEANSFVSSYNEIDMIELKTATLSSNVFLKLIFGTAQSEAFTERLLLNTQKYVNTLAFNAKIFVARAIKGVASVYAQGYGSETVETCSATYFTDNYSNTQSVITKTSNSTTSNLRNLQTSEEYYYQITQSSTDSTIVNLTSIKNKLSSQLSSVELLKQFVGTDVAFTGETFNIQEVKEVQMTSEKFIIDNVSYDKTTGNITLIPKADRNITCNWKLNSNIDLLTANNILDCAAGTETCGTIEFKKDNTETTTLTVGSLIIGKYYINVYCSSDIPESTNNIIFKNAETIIVTTEVPSSTSSTDVDCFINSEDPSCTNSIFIKISITICVLLALVFFDF